MSKKENNRKQYNDYEEQEQTYNNLDSFKGFIQDVKEEDFIDREDNIDDNFGEEEKEVNSGSDKRTKRKKLNKRSNKRKESEDYEEENDDDEDEEESQESEFSDKFMKKKRSRGKKNKKKKLNRKKKRGVEEFFEQEAESDEEEESEVEGEITKAEQEQLTKKLYEKKDRVMQGTSRKRLEILDQDEEQLRLRYEGWQEEPLDHENYEPGDIIGQQGRQPSISDPKLWLVKCRPGKEKESVENLYHKYFSMKSDENRIKILSACTFDALKGFIYVEAFKEANVREAVQGISALRENSIKIVPLTEMTQVFNFDKIKKIDLKPKQWVRIKSGLFEGDLAQVIYIEDPISKIYIKLIPRISEDSSNSQNKKDSIGDFSKKIRKSVRPRQKLFNPTNFSASDVTNKPHPILRDSCYMWNKMSFIDGFLVKSVKAKSLITEDVLPRIDELRLFDLMKMKNEGQQVTDIDNLISTIQQTEITTKKKKFAKGDKVKIIKGTLKSITGRVDSHANGVVRMIGDIEGVTDILEFPEDYIVKDFLPGDLVKVVNGPHVGKHGLIVRVDDGTAHIFSESSMSEFKASCHDIVSSTYQMNETEYNPYFQLGDLVKISGTNNVGYVLDVQKYSLKLMDLRSEIRNISVREVTKLTQIKPNGIDSKRNPITKDDTVKIINGPYKGKRAVIKNIYRNFCFLYNQDFVSTNGIFVDNSHNLEIMGSELLGDNYNMTGGRVNYKKVPEELRQMIGKTIKIIKGNWKGYIGILKKVTDKNAMIELSSKNKIISLDLSCIIEAKDDNSSINQGFVSTPRSNNGPKTPAYYPQSPSFNPTSPSWNPTSTPAYYLQANSPNPRREGFMSPGSNYK